MNLRILELYFINMHVRTTYCSYIFTYLNILVHNDLLGCNYCDAIAHPTMPCIYLVLLKTSVWTELLHVQ